LGWAICELIREQRCAAENEAMLTNPLSLFSRFTTAALHLWSERDGGNSALLEFLVTCLIQFAENFSSTTCSFFPSTCQARGSNANAKKSGSLATSFCSSPRAHPRVERGKDGAHVLQAVYYVTRGTRRCSRGAFPSSKLGHRRRERKLGRRWVSP
jgi:hypothetical protein